MDFDIDVSELSALADALVKTPQIIKAEMERTAKLTGFMVQGEAIHEAPVDKGILQGMIRPPVVTIGAGGTVTKITSHAEYSKAVHDGTRPHVITPKYARVLAWGPANGKVFARRVNHPGTTANPYMKRALEKSKARITAAYAQAAANIAKKAVGA